MRLGIRLALTPGRGPGWTPAALDPGVWLRRGGPLWADAARTVPATTTARVWDDASGNALHMAAPSAAERVLTDTASFPGFTAAYFDGLDSLLSATVPQYDWSASTVFLRLLPTRQQDVGRLFTGGEYHYTAGGSGVAVPAFAIAFGPQATGADVAAYTLTLQYTAIDSRVRVNGVEATGAARGAPILSTTCAVGNSGAGGAQPLQGVLAEFIFCPRACSAAEIAATEAYLDTLAAAGTGYPLTAPLVCFDGNSITAGAGGVTNREVYSAVAVKAVSPVPYHHRNGWGGATAADLTGTLAATSGRHFSAVRVKNVFVGWEITNSIGTGRTAPQALADLAAYCTAARAAGANKVILLDCLDRKQTGMIVSVAAFAAVRAAVNSALAGYASGATADPLVWAQPAGGRVIDFDWLVKVSAIPELADSSDAAYYDTSKVHPLAAGHALIGPPVAAACGLALA